MGIEVTHDLQEIYLSTPYTLHVYSRLDSTSKISREKLEKSISCDSVDDLCRAIMRVASIDGWRVFRIENNHSADGQIRDVPLVSKSRSDE